MIGLVVIKLILDVIAGISKILHGIGENLSDIKWYYMGFVSLQKHPLWYICLPGMLAKFLHKTPTPKLYFSCHWTTIQLILSPKPYIPHHFQSFKIIIMMFDIQWGIRKYIIFELKCGHIPHVCVSVCACMSCERWGWVSDNINRWGNSLWC